VVEYLPLKLSSNPSRTKKKERKKENSIKAKVVFTKAPKNTT
jgi:hypothetical protein